MKLNEKILMNKKIRKLKKNELIHLIDAFINLDRIKNLKNNDNCVDCFHLNNKLNK